MVNLDKLWDYSVLDMEVERFEAQMRKAPKRVKLLSLRNYLIEQQNNMKKVEADVASMADRFESVKGEIEKSNKMLSELTHELEDAGNDSIAELDGLIEEAEKLTSGINKLEQELRRLRKESENSNRHQRDIRTNAAQKKAEYDKLKAEYDVELKQDTEKLKGMKVKVEEAARSMEPGLLEHYKTVRQHCIPPMARLINNQCMGCNMSLPSAVMHRIADGNEIVECDNCGAILYIKE